MVDQHEDELNARLGRLVSPDSRDLMFTARPYLQTKSLTTDDEIALERGYRYWWADGWWGDQFYTPQCVAYSWLHLIEDGPYTTAPLTPQREAQHDAGAVLRPTELYSEAQLVDEWEGEDYDGTSVRAGAKVLQTRNLIGEYRWLFNVEEVADAILRHGPVVVGTLWMENMTYPSEDGLITPGGRTMGGHAYLLNGVNTNDELLRIKNSWGRQWGKEGFAYISFEDMDSLIRNQGEACISVPEHRYDW